MQKSNLRTIDLNLLVVLESLLNTRSVSRTAEVIGLSQPAVSRALTRLRTTFNDPLLVRSGQGMVPTPFITNLAGDLADVLNRTRELFALRDFDPSASSLQFRINAPDATVTVLFSKILGRVRQSAPNIKFSFTNSSESRLENLASGQIDLAVDLYEEVPPGFHSKVLIDDRLVCVSSKNHPGAGSVIDQDFLTRASYVEMGTRSGRALELFLRNDGIHLNYGARVSNFTSAIALVAETDLLTFLPYNLAKLLGAVFPISLLELPFELPRHPLEMVWHDRMHYNQSHQWLREQIVATLQEVRLSVASDTPPS